MTDQSPKLCINCKHIGKNGSGDPLRYRCFAPQNIAAKRIDLVTGDSITDFRYENCYNARLSLGGGNCSKDGLWFEPAPPAVPLEVSWRDEAKKAHVAGDLLNLLGKMK